MSAAAARNSTYIALTGGVGGAKLALGLTHALAPGQLTVAVNTGDDFDHLGLHISPDIDTLLYTLAGLANAELGWGLAGETWHFMAAIGRLGGPTWFRLGDADLATHVERTRRLAAGETLSQVTHHLAHRLGVRPHVVPMCDQPVRTVVETRAHGTLAFQEYFVGHKCEPAVRAIRFDGADRATPAPALIAALTNPALAGIIICPSNPWLSIEPLLAVPGMREALRASGAPIVAVTPIIGGKAIKGPTAKIMGELGLELSALTVAAHYRGLIDGFVLDRADEALAGRVEMPAEVTSTLMLSLDDRIRLAESVIGFCDRLGRQHRKEKAA